MSRLALVPVVLSTVLAFTVSALAERRNVAPVRPQVSARPLSKVLEMSDAEKARLPAAVKNKAIREYGLPRVALSKNFLDQHNDHYKVQLPDETGQHRIRNQRASGRCWIYATDRVLRSVLRKKGMSRPPELSTAYINYYALRNKAYDALARLAIGTKQGKEQNPMLASAVQEGGLEPIALTIIAQEGIVPRSVMHSSADSRNSATFLNRLQTLLASASQEFQRIGLKPEAKKQRIPVAEKYVKAIDSLLDTTLGAPPAQFTIRGKTYTPKSYMSEYLGLKPADLDYVYLTNNPAQSFGRRYPVGGIGVQKFYAYNVSMKVIEEAAKKTLDSGEAVGFGVNVGNPYMVTRDVPQAAKGIMSLKAYNYGALIPEEKLSKRQRLKAGLDPANHDMAITGYDPKGRNGVRKWKVDNSWGVTANDRGHFHMYDDFFREYVDEVVVPRSTVPADVLAKLESRPAVGEKPEKAKK